MPVPSPVVQIRIAALALLAAALPVRGQSTDSLPRDSVPQARGALTPGLSAPARSFGSIRHSVDSSDLRRGARPRTLSELLQARLPGVSVLRYGGDPSEGSRVRVRGTVSVVGDPEPVVVLDGIPVSAPQQVGRAGESTASSRLDDVDPEDVERIEVLPGPAATTLFGAGASNGAIVITTKRGATGPARLTAWSQAALTSEPTTYPANYRQNGVDPVTGAPVADCDVLAIANRRCTPTTLDIWNPLESASPFRHGRYGAGGASVAGGPFGIRAFASTAVRSETSVLDGSGASRLNGRLNAERELFRGFVIGGNVGYVRREATLRADRVVARGLTGEAVNDTNAGYRAVNATMPGTRDGDRLSRSARINWYVLPWLRVNGVVGHDELAQDEVQRFRNGDTDVWETTARTWQVSGFVHGTAEATHHAGRLVRLRTLLSYEEANRRARDNEALVLTNTSDVYSSSVQWSSSDVRSWMLQERIDVGGNLFVNLGVRRVEGERSDGQPGWHPSVDAAWDAGRFGGGRSLRVRGAYAVGVPPRDVTEQLYYVPTFPSDPAPALLHPEQPREAEIGVDARWASRLDLSATYYDERTPKLIVMVPDPQRYGSVVPALAKMENRGVEVGARVGLLDRPAARWTASMTLTALRNRVRDVPGPTYWRYEPGLYDGEPFATATQGVYTFTDANGDGLPVFSEIAFTSRRMVGTVMPTREASVRSELALPRWGLTFAAALDHRGGHGAYDMLRRYNCGSRGCRAWQDPSVPLDEKVRVVAMALSDVGATYVEDASFTRLGELALAWAVPARFGRPFGNGLTLIVEARNVATWTGYTGFDPEVATAVATLPTGDQLRTLPAVPRTLGLRVEWR